ncbi:hypothetical protein ACF3NG_02205 [Aerococcaceae bacterium WGS1372]
MTIKQCFALMKVRLTNELKLNTIFNNNHRTNRSIAMFVGIILLYITILGQLGFYSYQLNQTGLGTWLPYLTFLLVHLSLLYFNAFMMYGEFFAFKDIDLLRSLPISLMGLIISRFTYLYLLESLALLLISPGILFTWGILSSRYSETVFWWLALGLFAPLLTIGISLIVSMVAIRFSQLLSQSKAAYNLINLLIIFFVSALPIIKTLQWTKVNWGELFGPRIWLLLARFQTFQIPMSQRKSIVAWIGASILIIIVALVSFHRYFDQLTVSLINQPTQQRKAETKQRTQLQSMIIKEFRLFFSLPVYFMNTAFMMISLPIGLIALILLPEYLRQIVISGLRDYMAYLAIILAGLVSITNTTAVSLSLEGKHINWLLSLPISPSMIYRSKVYFNLILFIPPTLLSSLLTIYILKLEGTDLVFTLLIPLTMVIFSSWLGILLNSYFQNFLWDNEAQVVKQSVAVIVNLLVIFGVCTLAWVMVSALDDWGSWLLVVSLATATYGIKQLVYQQAIQSI